MNLSFDGTFFGKHDTLKVVIEELEQRVVAVAAKIIRYYNA